MHKANPNLFLNLSRGPAFLARYISFSLKFYGTLINNS